MSPIAIPSASSASVACERRLSSVAPSASFSISAEAPPDSSTTKVGLVGHPPDEFDQRLAGRERGGVGGSGCAASRQVKRPSADNVASRWSYLVATSALTSDLAERLPCPERHRRRGLADRRDVHRSDRRRSAPSARRVAWRPPTASTPAACSARSVAAGVHASAPPRSSLESALEICADVLGVLQTDRHPHQPFPDPRRLPILGRHPPVGGARRVGDRRAGIAQVAGDRAQLDRVDHPPGRAPGRRRARRRRRRPGAFCWRAASACCGWEASPG